MLRRLSEALDAAGEVVTAPVLAEAGRQCADAWVELAEDTEGSSRADVHEAVPRIGHGHRVLDEAADAVVSAARAALPPGTAGNDHEVSLEY